MDLHDSCREEAGTFPKTEEVVPCKRIQEEESAEGFRPHHLQREVSLLPGYETLPQHRMGCRYEIACGTFLEGNFP